MKLAIVGSRSFNNYNLLKSDLDNFRKDHDVTEIISGGARGADTFAERYAEENKIKLTVYYADWEKHGKAAGYIRNHDIIKNCDYCMAYWDDVSKGTANSIQLCGVYNKPCRIVHYNAVPISIVEPHLVNSVTFETTIDKDGLQN